MQKIWFDWIINERYVTITDCRAIVMHYSINMEWRYSV